MIHYRRARIALAVALSASPVFAQVPDQAAPGPAAPSPEPSSLADSLRGPAKDSYDSATLLIRNGDYAGALTKFQQAYDLSKDPRLLVNMANCSKNLRAYARMQTLLQQYERDAAAGITPAERTRIDAALAAIKNLVGVVKLSVTPDDATVLLDGTTLGTSPLADPIVVDLGKHTLTVRMAGFDPVDRPLDIAGGTSIDVTVALTPSAHVAELIVATDDAASVAIDGTVVGSGKYHDKIGAGLHTVRVTETGKVPYQLEVDLHDGETRSLDVSLKQEKNGLLWLWVAGGAAVVAGAIVGGYVVANSANKSSDTTVPPPVPDGHGVTFAGFGR